MGGKKKKWLKSLIASYTSERSKGCYWPLPKKNKNKKNEKSPIQPYLHQWYSSWIQCSLFPPTQFWQIVSDANKPDPIEVTFWGNPTETSARARWGRCLAHWCVDAFDPHQDLIEVIGANQHTHTHTTNHLLDSVIFIRCTTTNWKKKLKSLIAPYTSQRSKGCYRKRPQHKKAKKNATLQNLWCHAGSVWMCKNMDFVWEGYKSDQLS